MGSAADRKGRDQVFGLSLPSDSGARRGKKARDISRALCLFFLPLLSG
jgi:hypothetical protein